MISQRDAFWNRIYELAENDADVLAVIADMGAPALDKFRKNLAAQYLDVGIAEQQALALASGLALSGKKPYAYAIAPFITMRCYEHTRVNLAGMNLPVTLVGVGAGFGYDDSGPTHHTLEDLSIMRILPNLKVFSISDSVMAEAFADISYGANYPCYVRLDRETLPDIYENDHDFSSGVSVVREGSTVSIVATGNMVHNAIEAADILGKKGISAKVVDAYVLPLNGDALSDAISDTEYIATLEEHTLRGGLGSAVCECLCDMEMARKVKRIGLTLERGYSYAYGGRKNLQKIHSLDVANVSDAIYRWVSGRS